MTRGSRSAGTRIALQPIHDDAIGRAIEAERRRLSGEAGLSVGPIAHFRRPEERPFTRAERERVTILFGGLTTRHERLVAAALEGLGYRVAIVPTPRKADFQAGKEYGNNGQCNPTYFTVGALVNYLKDLRDRRGLSRQQILDDYVFITAGACGPCRFGMYEAEYRLALENSGFGGFRVLLFQQGGGLSQAEVEAGIDFDIDFFLSLLNAIFMADLLNALAFQIRPYEVVPGRTDAVLEQCVAICQARLRAGRDGRRGVLDALFRRLVPVASGEEIARFVDQLTSDVYVDALRECRGLLQQVEVDYTRARPIVKVTGEFWAQTTEGDGNFHMFRFLEGEGADVLVEPVATWIAYMLNQARTRLVDRRGLGDGVARPRSLAGRWREARRHRRARLRLALARAVLWREYERLRVAIGATTHALVDQGELQRVAHPFYNTRAGGGEGHLEVAKSIYYSTRGLAHMVLSLKPFGCMPSTQSDGAHAAVMARHPDLLFLPVETSGEGDINAHSRVQMALSEAKAKARAELRDALDAAGCSLEEVRAYVAARPELRRPMQRVPERPGVVGRAASFCLHVAVAMRSDRGWRGATAAASGTR